MKRILEMTPSELRNTRGRQLLESIQAAEGRTIVAEVVAPSPGFVRPLTNAEVAAAFGADLILLNGYDSLQPAIGGLPADGPDQSNPDDAVRVLKQLVGRPIGINLEPCPPGASISTGRQASRQTVEAALRQGVDFVVLTGNPGTGVSNPLILDAIRQCREVAGDRLIVVAGKMHAAGVLSESGRRMLTEEDVEAFVGAGADVVLLPAPGTVPGFTVERVAALVDAVHRRGALVLAAIGTCQESSDPETVREFGLAGKMAGADVLHIGDCGYGGMAPPENIMALSIAVKGRLHTLRRMAMSELR
ncbi:MAG: haloacid dehalogenase-like hydrolase [Bacillota bacterium]